MFSDRVHNIVYISRCTGICNAGRLVAWVVAVVASRIFESRNNNNKNRRRGEKKNSEEETYALHIIIRDRRTFST